MVRRGRNGVRSALAPYSLKFVVEVGDRNGSSRNVSRMSVSLDACGCFGSVNETALDRASSRHLPLS
jgi:hypothetical protein